MTSSDLHLFGGIEGGGTKFVCAISDGSGKVLSEVRFPTTTPQETLQKSIAFFQQQETELGKLAAIGIAMFGPIDPQPGSPTYGHILETPKPGWSNTDVVSAIRSAFDLPVGFDTDVNGAALGEWRWGAAQGLDPVVYLTVGTGIGGGGLVNGRLLHGLLHPEMGHIPVPHDRNADPYPGLCPFHGDCLEGLASGPAIEGRWRQLAQNLPPEHPAWDLEAHYLALALVDYICILSPEVIVLGGGVMEQAHLFPRIQRQVQEVLNGYLRPAKIMRDISSYIVPAGLGNRAGISGALALAEQAYQAVV